MLLVYVALHGFLLATVESGVHLREGADAPSWFDPALALVKHGWFVMLDDPATPMTYRQPLYPLFEAGLLWAGPGLSPKSVVVGQIVALWLTGLFARAMVEPWLPGYGLAALALVVFNPNAVGTAHLIQSDTLYSLFVAGALWATLRYALAPSTARAVLSGLLLGLSCLVRPTGQYAILLLPLLMPLLNLAVRHGTALSTGFRHGAAAAVIAGITLVPWMLHNAQAGQGFVLSAPALKVVYLRDNSAYLEKYAGGGSLQEATARLYGREAAYVEAQAEDWAARSEFQRQSDLVDYYFDVIRSYAAPAYFRAYAASVLQFFGAAGAANLHNLLELEAPSAFAAFNQRDYGGYVAAVLDILARSSPPAVAISVAALLLTFGLRLLGLVGIVEAALRRHYAVLLVCLGLIAYFAVIHLFTGNSRYRLPVEPALVFIALYGVAGLRARFARSRAT